MRSLKTIQEGFYRNTKSGVNNYLQSVVDKIKQYSNAESVSIVEDHIEVSGNMYGGLHIEDYPDSEFGCQVVVLGSVKRLRIYDCRLTSLSELEFSSGMSDTIFISKTDMETIDLDIKCPLNSIVVNHCKNLKYINFTECNKFSMEKMDIEYNPNLEAINISNLKSIDKIELQNCPELKDLNLNTDIKSEIYINKCESLTSLGSIKKIGFGRATRKCFLEGKNQRRTVIEIKDVSQDFDIDNISSKHPISQKCTLFYNSRYKKI